MFFSKILRNKTVLITCFFLLITVIVFMYRDTILFNFMKYKLFDKYKAQIDGYLSRKEKGIELAISSLRKTRLASRGSAYFILLLSPLDDIVEPRLDEIVWQPVTNDTIAQIIEATCIMLERTRRSVYLFRLYKLIRHAEVENCSDFHYRNYLISEGRDLFLSYALENGKEITGKTLISEEMYFKYVDWPIDMDFPEELDAIFLPEYTLPNANQ